MLSQLIWRTLYLFPDLKMHLMSFEDIREQWKVGGDWGEHGSYGHHVVCYINGGRIKKGAEFGKIKIIKGTIKLIRLSGRVFGEG